MARLNRNDVVSPGGELFVVLESELPPPAPTLVVILLIDDSYPVVPILNPTIRFDGRAHLPATRLVIPVRRSVLRHVGDVEDQGDAITRAVDVMMAGV